MVSLASSARWLLAAGRKDAALEMYRKALEVASHRELSRYGAPRFSDDPAAPRVSASGRRRSPRNRSRPDLAERVDIRGVVADPAEGHDRSARRRPAACAKRGGKTPRN